MASLFFSYSHKDEDLRDQLEVHLSMLRREGLIDEVGQAAVALRCLRRETTRKLNYSLRDLYRTLERVGDNPLRGVHARLDTAVRAAYGMPHNADPLTFLLALNLACAAKEKASEEIKPPGLPLPAEARANFITDDCIRVSEA
jgi:hypothetical protein